VRRGGKPRQHPLTASRTGARSSTEPLRNCAPAATLPKEGGGYQVLPDETAAARNKACIKAVDQSQRDHGFVDTAALIKRLQHRAGTQAQRKALQR